MTSDETKCELIEMTLPFYRIFTSIGCVPTDLDGKEISIGGMFKISDLKENKKDNDSPAEEKRGCPCMYLNEPCHPHCTCRNGYSSFGCLFCCRYGSKEQRATMANRIADKIRKS
jgi:hypothetical protein